MISLYQFLTEKLNYSDEEAEETVLRYEISLPIPPEIKDDIKLYWKLSREECHIKR